jgi:hypothetical protein
MNKELLKSNLNTLSTINNEYTPHLIYGAIALLLEHGGH